ncbi:hypothetical protein [Streptomyces purpurogeneiscleroticus]|uniref:hypothetical protein n=1 Tax=Streptomyces purpurogeneiscleroticus TaxID=68259 RepID=UPI001CBE54D8|nr:hypothetical protein [Streptomyces purpurogeneiscleroticus]
MSDAAWSIRLSAKAGQALRELPDHGQDMARDVLDIATRTPWGWPQWDRRPRRRRRPLRLDRTAVRHLLD